MTPTVLDLPPTGEPAVRVLGGPLPIPVPRSSGEGTRSAGPRHARPSRSRWVDHLLTLLAVVGVLTTGVTVFAAHSGLRPLVVRSGSMEPAIATGSMVLVRQIPAAEIRPGQVVAVVRPDRTRVTHRVVSVEHRGATAELVLKGDANTDPDPAPVTVAHAGLYVTSLPWLGRMGAFLGSARGGFVLGFVVAAVLLAVVRGRRA